MFDLNEPASEPPPPPPPAAQSPPPPPHSPPQPPESIDGGGGEGGGDGVQEEEVEDSKMKISEECRGESSRQDWGNQRSSSWPRSKPSSPKLPRSSSFQMLFSTTSIPKSPAAIGGDAGGGDIGGGEVLTLGGAATTSTATTTTGSSSATKSFCEFLQLKTNDSHDEGDRSNTVASDDEKTRNAVDVERDSAGPSAAAAASGIPSASLPPLDPILEEEGQVEEEDRMCIDAFAQQQQLVESEPLLDDSKFSTVFWQGDINFEGSTVANLVAGCTREWQHVFKNRRVAGSLAVQRFTGADKFLSAVKESMVEPSARIVQKSGSETQDITKLVQVLAGDDLSSKGPAIAVIPLHDEGGVWAAELYLVTGSILSEVEPGELNVSDEEDIVYGFLSFSADTDDTYTGLTGARIEVDTSLSFLDTRRQPQDAKIKRQGSTMSGDRETVDKRVQDLEEGQLVSEGQGVKEVVYEKRKRYSEEDSKRGKVNGDSDAKAKDKHSRHRDHDREDRSERGRRERDDRDRDRELYTRRVYDYIPRLDKSRYREGDRRGGDHRDTHWETERRGSSKETPRERSRSREREKDKLASSKDLSRSKSSSKPASKPAPDVTKKRERSPLDSSKTVASKRLKDGSSRTFPADDRLRMDAQNGDANGDSKYHCPTIVQVTGSEVYCELVLDVAEEETRAWLLSRQHAAYLQEQFDVILTRAAGLTAEEPLRLKLSTLLDEVTDVPEAEYFVHHAADIVKTIAQHGVFSKCIWYTGPVQQYSNEMAPAVHLVVKKLQGDIDKIQEDTGVRMRVVLDADGKKSVKSGRTSLVGVELKGLKRKDIHQATQQVHALFRQVIGYFAKPLVPPIDKPVVKAKLVYVSGLPEYASDRMVKAIFENALREKLKIELPPGFEANTEVVLDVKYFGEHYCAFVELASDELLEAAFQLYISDKSSFCGLTVEVPSPSALKIYQQSLLEVEDKHDDDGDSDYEGPLDGSSRRAVKPLYLTELPRNASSESVQQLFEDIITTHITSSQTSNMVKAVRHIPSRGCMFVDLATQELVTFMLDLHARKPEVFGHMKMELGRNFLPAVAETDRKRAFGGSMERSRSGRNYSPPRGRRREDDDYEDYHEYGRSLSFAKKQRSDPEKTVYADHLPENSTEAVIRKIFERIMFKHMTAEQRTQEVVTEVRHVKAKFCAFVVFASEDLARLALELYNKDEDVFDQMRLKPHFNSRLEDMYRDETHDRDEDAQSSRGSEDYHHEYQEVRGRRAGTVFKEVDRRRSVYVDRIPEKFDEAAIKDILDRFLKRKGRNSPLFMVSHVSFFRDKYDPSKLCAFVEVKHEAAVQELLDCYNNDEEAFDGMRIRPAVKY